MFSIFVMFVALDAHSFERRFNFFIYVNATDPSIEQSQLKQLDQLERTRKKSNANYFIQVKNSHGLAQRFLLNEKGRSNEEILDTIDYSSWREIASFVEWGNELSPAEENILIFNSHGSFYGGTNSSVINSDYETGESTSIHEYVFALEYVKRALGKALDIIVFDACFMSTIEVQVQTFGYADFFVGSRNSIHEIGLDYAEISRRIADDYLLDEINVSIIAEMIQNSRVTPLPGNLKGSKLQETDPEVWPMSAYKLKDLPPFVLSLRDYIDSLLKTNPATQLKIKSYITENTSHCAVIFRQRLMPGQTVNTPKEDWVFVSGVILLGPFLKCLNPENFSTNPKLAPLYEDMMSKFEKYSSFRKKKSVLDFLESEDKYINDGIAVIFHPKTFQDPELLKNYRQLRFDYFSSWSKLALIIQ